MSIKTNYFASIIQIFVNLVFPILTFPYAARILGPDGIGAVEQVNAIVYYFLMFVHLGIPTYGVRMVAKHRTNKVKLNKIISELLVIHCISSIIVAIVFYFSVYISSVPHQMEVLLFIAGVNILISPFALGWVIQGVEKHVYQSVVHVISKFITLILLFLLVTDSQDVAFYLMLSVIANVFIAICGLFLVKKQIRIQFSSLSLKKHFKPIISATGLSFSASIIFYLNVVMIGFFLNEIMVGIYTAASRFIRLSEGIVSQLAKVAMPRAALYMELDYEEALSELNKKVYEVTVALALPVTVGVFLFAEHAILLLAGEKFVDSIYILQLLSPLILLTGITGYLYNQIVFPKGKDKELIIIGFLMAGINFLLNLLFIPWFGIQGAAYSLLLATIAGLASYIFVSLKITHVSFFSRDIFITIVASVLMLLGSKQVSYYVTLSNKWMLVATEVLACLVIFTTTLVVLKHSVFMEVLDKMIKKQRC